MSQLRIKARGHTNIRSTHKTTWQLTTENQLTPRGNCIIGTSASIGAAALPTWLKNHLQAGEKIRIRIQSAGLEVVGTAEGHPDLTFQDPVDLVFRRSDYTCPRTVAIRSSLVAKDLPPEMVAGLQRGAGLRVIIQAIPE